MYEIIIDITNRCYLNCKYCGTGAGSGNEVDLPVKYIEELLHYAKLNGATVFLGGGCFYCHPEYERILKYLRQKKSKNVIIDLPSCQDTLDKIMAYPMDGYSISLSLWGIREVHDKLACKDSYRLVDQFKNVMRQKQGYAAFSFVMSKELISQTNEVIGFVNELGRSDSVYFHRMMPTGRCGKADLPKDIEIQEFVKRMGKEIKPELFSIVRFHHTVHSSQCNAFRDRLFIDWYGSIFGCGWVGENKPIGNIQSLSIEEIRSRVTFPVYKCPIRSLNE